MKIGALTKAFTGIVMGALALAGQLYAAEPEFKPELTDDDKVVNTVCKSDKPFFVIDFFSTKKPDYGHTIPEHMIDIDGDGILDIQHGKMVGKVAELTGKKIITYGLTGNPASFDIFSIIKGLFELTELIESKKIERPAAIILSHSIAYNLEKIHNLLGRDLSITFDNIADKKDDIVARIKGKFDEKGSSTDINYFHRLHELFGILKEMGVPAITGAGNDYSENFNLLGVLGALPVGALTHDGNETAPYSDESSLINVRRPGDFIGHEIPGGIDINNDGQVDFKTDELSNGEKITAQFNGQSIFNESPAGEHRIPLFSEQSALNSKNTKKHIKTYGEYRHAPSDLLFRGNAAGKLIFDPANDGDPTQVTINSGTSFAAPNICSK